MPEPVSISVRAAERRDVAAIVAMLRDDELGRTREIAGDEVDDAYVRAFDAIARDPNQLLLVAESGDEVVGTLQLTFIPGLSRGGAWRGQIEAVRVAAGHRGKGVGRQMVMLAIDEARRRGCALVQLTTDRRRPRAHEFYERLGFESTHLGMKLALD